MTKTITAVVRGTGNPQVKDLQIQEGTTGKDIKRKLKIPVSFNIVRKNDGSFLNDTVDLHTLLQEGEKIELSMHSDLGF